MNKIISTKFIIYITLLVLGLTQSAIANDKNHNEDSKINFNKNTTPPGVNQFTPALLKKIKTLRLQRGLAYTPRTRHLNTDGSAKYTNRLFLESSPYLLQHAHNPVNWYSWGDEAFETAARLKRPILLSVGYSTCHWCHVMEEESFEDEEIAKYINENFIAIKVDREERPDIDAIYMSALHAMGQNGGWPMSLWLTADKKPFYGGTYFPARDGDRGVHMGFFTLLKKLKNVYDTQPYKIITASNNLAKSIQINLQPRAGTVLPAYKIMHIAADYYKNKFDPFYGGLGVAPKFPSSMPIQFLLRYYRRTQDKNILNIVKLTLNKMASGGMYDQVGGGFHRYSTDAEWLVPHFEKMLYDNALLVIDYLEAYQVTADENYKRIVNEILHYISRDMTSPEGGFYSATDADSPTPSGHNEEGYFFTWTREEIIEALGEKQSTLILNYYSVTNDGNFEGRNILFTAVDAKEFTEKYNISHDALTLLLIESKEILYQYRNKRLAPGRDEKILTSWNGLMISAYAKAGLAFNNQDYINHGIKAAHFIFNKLYINGRLLRSYKDNEARHNGYLDDYAFFIASLLDLYEATFDLQWINKAIQLDNIVEEQYEDKINGGFFMTSNDHEKLLARQKPSYDGAEPTGNSIHILNLLRLGEFTTKDSYKKRAITALENFSIILNERPMALSKMLLAVDFYYDKAKEIIIVSPENNNDKINALITEFRKQFVPNRILSLVTEGEDLKLQQKTIPLLEGKFAIKGKVTAYVCEQGSCKLPTHDPAIFKKQIMQTDQIMKTETINSL